MAPTALSLKWDFAELKQRHMAAVAGAKWTLDKLVSLVYDPNILTTPITRRYTTREGDPNRTI